MIDSKVIEYIKSEITKGVSRDEITKNLLNGGGWTPTDIQTYFSVVDGKPIPEDKMVRKSNYPTRSGAILIWNVFLLFLYEVAAYGVVVVGSKGVHTTFNGYSNIPDAMMPIYEHYDYLRKLGQEKLIYIFLLHAFILFILSAIKKDAGKPAKPWALAGLTVLIFGVMGWFGLLAACYDGCRF